MVMAAVTRPRHVNCRVLIASQEKATHEQAKVLKSSRTASVTKEKAIIEDHNTSSRRVLVRNQVHTMSSGPSRRGSGH